MTKTKLLYICGETRSGSTLLSNILGSIEGFFNGGEIIEFWKRGMEWPCGCGKKTDACGIWSSIYKEVSANINDFNQMNQSIAHSAKSLKNVISFNPFSSKKQISKNLTYSTNYLYQQIVKKTKCNVIVDASKNPGYAQLLTLLPGFDLYILHIIRDPRATIFSWKNKKPGLWASSAKKIALRWNIRNIATELLKFNLPTHYYQLKYESMATHPMKYINEIITFMGEKPANSPFISENEVCIQNVHGLCGNPDKFKHGIIRIALDQRWQKGIEKSDQTFSTFANLPFILKYKYPIIP